MKQGVSPSTTPTQAGGDADTDTDTDTDTDSDTDLPEVWSGSVGVVLAETGDPFCEGEVQLSLVMAALTGGGECEVGGGPGAGQVLVLDFDGTLDADGALTGQVSITAEEIPEPPPPSDFTGQGDADSLELDFEFEIRDPQDPKASQTAEAHVAATPAG